MLPDSFLRFRSGFSETEGFVIASAINSQIAQAAPGALASIRVADFQIDALGKAPRLAAKALKRCVCRWTSSLLNTLARCGRFSLQCRGVMACEVGGVGERNGPCTLSAFWKAVPKQSPASVVMPLESRPVRFSCGSRMANVQRNRPGGTRQASGTFFQPATPPDDP